MQETLGLRERKKRETRRALRTIATRMFAERGFDAVTVAEIAAAAKVSTKTVFNYYATKEDLVLSGRDELDPDLAATLRAKEPGEPLLVAMQRHAHAVARRLFELPAEQRDALRQVVGSAPSVRARWRENRCGQEAELAAALIEAGLADGRDDADPAVVAAFKARLVASAVDLAYFDVTCWPKEEERTLDETLAAVDEAFAMLGRGLAG